MAGQALEGLRVVEFAAYAAGPCISKHLADHGAEVIHVESRSRPDGFRLQYPPYKDNVPGLNRGGLFALVNNDKYGVSLNLKNADGLALAHRLVARADVVVENFSPGTVARLGLGYNDVRGLNPGIIMLSTCNQGQTGPHAQQPGFGSHLTSGAGFTHLIGYEAGPPLLLYGPYIDYIAVGYGVIAILAALEYRRRTGEGQYIDMSQYETGLQFLADALLEVQANGRVPTRQGNRQRYAAPHGVYPCAVEEEWVVLSIWNDEEWCVLCELMGHPSWTNEEKFATVVGRKRNEEELDQVIGEWTSEHRSGEIAELLQSAGLCAAPVNSMRGVMEDPQLGHRGTWQLVEHPEIGPHHYEAPPFALSRTPGGVRAPAPLLGQHNHEVFLGLLGLSDEEYSRMEAVGAFD